MKKYLGLVLLQYFRLLAKTKLAQWNPEIIGVTGSAGKTSTMEAVAAVLADTKQVKTSQKANSESGIPLNILGLYPKSYSGKDWFRLAIAALPALFRPVSTVDTYVVELGIDGPTPPKNMGFHLGLLSPDIGIFTAVNTVHGQYFEPWLQSKGVTPNRATVLAAIAEEKGRLITTLPGTGTAILNADEPLILQLANKTKATVLTFGTSESATVRLLNTTHDSGTTFSFRANNAAGEIKFPKYLLPAHFGMSFAAALCVGLNSGLSLQDSCTSIEQHFQLPPGRATLIEGKHDTTIIDSSYNSSPEPLIDFLHLLQAAPGKRKLALLGDIRELGSASPSEHKRVGKIAADICDAVFLVGPAMHAHVLPPFEQVQKPAFVCSSTLDAAKKLDQYLRPDDILLVKGSQNTLLLEIAIERLMAHPELAEELLCRRGEFWDRERKKLTA
ncbi:MAG: UDP-N-acetylmuramoyl-tripeptide--D-alanyl-D-alanine ligase [bacterium]|nr:UDP-N-acetylmuramoyl-tripeptide--D-alanyl-D-alanine ligase [bacterium]